VPEGLDMDELEQRLVSIIPTLHSVHEMHVWTLAGKYVANLLEIL
jgi:Co/Zn/Cd efflux system component